MQEAQQLALQQATGGSAPTGLQSLPPPMPASVDKIPAPAAVTTAAPMGTIALPQQQQLMPAAVGVPAIPVQQQALGGIPVAQVVGVLPPPGGPAAGGMQQLGGQAVGTQPHTVTETVVVTTSVPGGVPTVVGHHKPVRATCASRSSGRQHGIVCQRTRELSLPNTLS